MELEKLRKEINKIDTSILTLLKKRMKIASSVSKMKSFKELERYDAKREKEILDRLIKENKNVLPIKALKIIYQEIISACRSLNKPLIIAYLGPEATFTHLATIKKFGSSNKFTPLNSIKEIFLEVEKDRADYGVVPIENSTEGSVNYTLDMFMDTDLKICDEILLEIHECLLSNYSIYNIKKIYSHQQALAQCRYWLENNLPGRETIEVSSTSMAAQYAIKEKNTAVIASKLGAKIYGLKILAENIEDSKNNITRFLVIGKKIGKQTGNDKTSIMFSIKDKVGALYEVLRLFKSHNINLTQIESRPSRVKPWEYFFFVDFEGHSDELNVKKVFSKLEKHCTMLKILGAYSKAKK